MQFPNESSVISNNRNSYKTNYIGINGISFERPKFRAARLKRHSLRTTAKQTDSKSDCQIVLHRQSGACFSDQLCKYWQMKVSYEESERERQRMFDSLRTLLSFLMSSELMNAEICRSIDESKHPVRLPKLDNSFAYKLRLRFNVFKRLCTCVFTFDFTFHIIHDPVGGCWLCSRNSETHDENLFFCSLHWTNASDKSTMSFLLIQTTRVSAWMPKIAMKKIMQMAMEHFISTTNPSTQCIFS